MSTEAVQFAAIRALEKNPARSQRELASDLGISVGKVNYCLKALVAKGLLKVENYRSSQNRAAYLYVLTPKGIAAKAQLTRRFLARKVEEYEQLRCEIEELEAEARRASE
jgi:EPS-associated MarR family transcriptional regulator